MREDREKLENEDMLVKFKRIEQEKKNQTSLFQNHNNSN